MYFQFLILKALMHNIKKCVSCDCTKVHFCLCLIFIILVVVSTVLFLRSSKLICLELFFIFNALFDLNFLFSFIKFNVYIILEFMTDIYSTDIVQFVIHSNALKKKYKYGHEKMRENHIYDRDNLWFLINNFDI